MKFFNYYACLLFYICKFTGIINGNLNIPDISIKNQRNEGEVKR